MVRKWLCFLSALALVCLCGAALADDGVFGGKSEVVRPAVVDEADLFTSGEEAEIETILRSLRDRFQVEVVVLTTVSTPRTGDDSVLVDWADRYYETHGYGLGPDRAGMVYMIDMVNRYNYISTAGVMIDYLSDRRIESLLDTTGDYLKVGRYGSAAKAMLNKLVRMMEDGIEEGSFRFDSVTGQRLTGLYNKLTRSELMLALAVGAGVMLLIVLSVKGSYSLSGSTYRYDSSNNASLKLTHKSEQFLRQRVTRTPKSSGSGGGSGGGHGGSGVHISSGGMSHGGGGRHF